MCVRKREAVEREAVGCRGLGFLVYEDGVDAKSLLPGPPYKQIGTIGQDKISHPDGNYQLGAPENRLMEILNRIPPSRIGRIGLFAYARPNTVRI